MSSNPLRLQFLFRKYLDNSCNPQELQEFWKLISELSENDVISDELRDLWQNKQLTDFNAEVSLDKAFGTLQQKIDQYRETSYSSLKPAKRRPMVPVIIAASLLACILVIWWLNDPFQSKQKTPGIKIAAEVGPQLINLPDGSVITLNSGSKLVYPPAFNLKTRDVYLTGEAYFDIVSDSFHPFIVHTREVITKVLGTTFNIQAYPNDPQVYITVVKGKVQVQKKSARNVLAVLNPGEQLIVTEKTERSSLVKADLSKVLEWKKADLVFDNTSLDEVVLQISNQFRVDIRIRNEAMRYCRFTADLSKVSLDQALDIITVLTHSKWQRAGKNIIWIEGPGCP